ncbi:MULTISPECIES: EAL domain-containing protein [unclassified Leptolyngbya]|uniref:putative bifunctional diguanylate cyclase/phosphodiesterase n=1 Tax=unclassified Leptolyngbya TaxID=2650499 RepID=UPI0016853BC8|nr:MULTISPECIES: EAL domain-containing protein [unclassified Leptolyngbya]MBD1912035.1 EAL domain-containing protein [Leptolyngbya sp. FACHB-8]MBD2155405.1 EAL domain-containing protein [Leptolyngbya sp. FACHB-16]
MASPCVSRWFRISPLIATYILVTGLWFPASSFLVKQSFTQEIWFLVCDFLQSCGFVLFNASFLCFLIARQKRAITNRNDLLQAVIESTKDAIYIKNLQGRYVLVNAQAAQLLQHAPEAILGKTDEELFGAEIAAHHQLTDQQVIHMGVACDFVEPVHPALQQPLIASTKLPWCTRTGQIRGLIGIAQDVTEKKEVEDRLRRPAFYDALTGLPRRALLLRRLQALMPSPHRSHAPLFALLYLDVSRIEDIKYILGADFADDLVVAIAYRLQQILPEAAILARTGSLSEFIILLESLEHFNEAIYFAEKVLAEIAQPFHLEEREIFVNANIGILLSTHMTGSTETMLQAADSAMHEAKRQGYSNYVIFQPAMQEAAFRRLALDGELRLALERQEFSLHYQPIVSLSNHHIIGFEALVRWEHPNWGSVPPAEFISLAEETGFIMPLGFWILRQACQQLRQWQRQFPELAEFTLSINISVAQLFHPNFLEQVDQILLETQVTPHRLKLELTETAIMKMGNRVAQVLEALKSRQLRLSIDDFGTGYSSLSYLHLFPLDTLKIDQSFVRAMTTRHEVLEIVRSIISLSHALNIQVTAEGVETLQQINQLRSLGCEFGQGFLFSKPVPVHLAEKMLVREASRLKPRICSA